MDNLLVKKKPIAVDKRAKLDVAECVIDVLHAKKIPAQSTSKETKTVEDLVMNSSSRSNAAETAKFEHGYQAMLEVEEGLQKNIQKDARLLCKLLSIQRDPTSDVIAAIDGVRSLLRFKDDGDIA